MKKHAILSARGRDRIGIADDLSAALMDRGVGIEDSRWTTLGGQFSLVVQISGEEDDVAALQRDLGILRAKLAFDIHLQAIDAPLPIEKPPRFLIESFSSGPSGVGVVTGLLKKYGINIEQLETEASATPWTSRITFHMKATVAVPASCNRDRLREELRELERERDIDIVIKSLPRTRDRVPVS